MKILILYAKVGNGHLKAAEAIKECIETQYTNAQVSFQDGLEYSSSFTNMLVIKGYKNMTKHIPELWGGIYNSSNKTSKGTINEFYKFVNKWLTVKLMKMVREEKPSIIVSTHPFISKMLAYLKRKGKVKCPIVSIVTDYAAHSMWVTDYQYIDKIIVATETMKRDCMQLYGVPSDKMEVLGIPSSLRFKKQYTIEEKENIRKSFGLQDKQTFLLFAGGGLGIGQTTGILKDILKLREDFELIVVCGKNEKQYKKFQKIISKQDKKVLLLGYTNQVPELMAISTSVVTKPGGLTSTECLCMQKPMICINPIPGQEEENATFFVNAGTALRVTKGNNISTAISAILTNDLRYEQMQAMCKQVARPNATEDITNLVMNLANKGGVRAK